MARDHRSVPRYRHDVAMGYNNLARIYERLGEPDRQREALATAQSTLQELVREYPRLASYRFDLAKVEVNLAIAQLDQGRRAEAQAMCREAVALLEPEVRVNPGQLDYAVQLGGAYVTLGDILLDKPEKAAEALAVQDQALRILGGVVSKAKAHQEGRYWYCQAQRRRGLALLLGGKIDEARAAWDRALAAGYEEPDVIQREQALSFALQGDHARAVLPIEQDKTSNPPEFYEKACVYALAAAAVARDGQLAGAERRRRAGRLEDRAVSLLADCYPGSATYEFPNLHKNSVLGVVLAPLAQRPELLYVRARADGRSAQAAKKDDGVTPEQRRALVEKFTRRALDELAGAQAQGYFKTPSRLQKLKEEGDLTALHSHPEFQKLLRAAARTAPTTRP
jgi:tetratricopeptide (TPR) repeat protein